MASLNSLQIRALTAQTTGIRVTDGTPVALRITHVSADAVTSVAVTTGTSIVLTDAAAATTVDFATYATLGAVADKINNLANWRCKLLDGLRTMVTTANIVTTNAGLTANSSYGEYGYDVLLDSTVAFTMPIRITYDRSASRNKPNSGHRVKLNEVDYVMNVGTAAADMVQIWEWDPVLRTETQIWQGASVDSTSTVTTLDFSKAPITSKEGNDLIVLVTDAASFTAASTNYLQALYTRE
jgi:hypothetical protein